MENQKTKQFTTKTTQILKKRTSTASLLSGTDLDVEIIRMKRTELENFMFNDANKISRTAMKFILEKWNDLEARMFEIKLENEKLKTIIEEKNKIEKTEQSNIPIQPLTYAQAVTDFRGSRRRKIGNQSAVVIIGPQEDNAEVDNEQIKKTTIEILERKNKTIKVKNLKKSKNKGVILELDDEKEVEKIESADFESKGLKIRRPKKNFPTAIVYDIEKDADKTEFINSLWDKNLQDADFDREQLLGKIKYKFATRTKDRGKENWVLELPAPVYRYLLAKGRAYVDWHSHRIKEFINVSRCYKCLNYGHSAKTCKAETPTCEKCGGEGHVRKDCPDRENDEMTCINCKRNKRDFKHRVTDKNCPEYQKQVEICWNRIDWN